MEAMRTPMLRVSTCALLVLAACGRDAANDEKTSTTTLTGAQIAGATAPKITDAQIEANVQQAIATEPLLPGSSKNVTVSTHDGQVTLSGAVSSERDKDTALRTAERVPGVIGVVSRIEIKNASAGDNVDEKDAIIQLELVRTIRKRFPAAAKTVRVDSTNGLVTLRGTVPSAEQEWKMVNTAQSIAGVAAVDNDLEVNTPNAKSRATR
jgi:osmotically-inducible protein OsmY